MKSLLVFMIMLCAVTQTDALDVKESDQVALMAIKSKIVDDPEGALSSWNNSFHFCQWEGVTCGRRHRRVTVLDLSSKSLSGSLSPFVGNLSFLKEIRLQNNTLLKGVIPTEIGRLFRLERLVLLNNSFEGNFPDSLSNCTNLKSLSIGHNKFVGTILQNVCSLLKLVSLSIHLNNFAGEMPPCIGNLTSLETLFARGNHFGGSIPYTIGQLQKLSYFGVGSNQLHGTIPPSFYNLSLLYLNSISDNHLVGSLPIDIGLKLPNLQVFQIWGNNFTGVLPFSISNCSNLQYISVGFNLFYGKIEVYFGMMPNLWHVGLYDNFFGNGEPDDLNFMASLVNCSNLQQIELYGNQLGGKIPSSVGNLSAQLSYLSLSYNSLYGSIPPSIMNLVSLEQLFLQNNNLTGIIPSNLGNLQQLQVLILEENSLIGNIPESVGNLSLLSKVFLGNNRLQGEIPTTFGSCHSLILLFISSNNLTGSIPKELLGLSSLSISLNLSRNHLTGSLPLEIGKLHNLKELDLSENELAGEIPSSIGGCTSLENLFLGGNYFQGLIPSSFGSLTAIQNLDISRNNFSGEIPTFLGKLAFKNLNLSFNDFEGEVPMNGVFTNATAFSVDGNNRLCGGMPKLQFPKCSTKEGKTGKKMSFELKVLIPIMCLLVVVALASCWLFIWHKKRIERQSSGVGVGVGTRQPFTTYSYEMLLKATNGFSSENLIGAGCFSRVFKGVFEEDGTIVAVKVLNLDLLGALKSFMAECEVWKNIRHRNLVKIITACSSVNYKGNDFKALVYEFMPNGSLDSWLHNEENGRQGLSLLQRINIAIDIVHAIDYLHNRCEIPIIHCDIKPSNILLDGDMVAHVGDFGLARFILPQVSSSTQSNSIGLRGTVGYAPSEYGLGRAMSAPGDVYSFGITLLEMMTGKRPTNSMFKDGLNLHNYARMALSDCIMDIVDPILVKEDENEIQNPTYANKRMECMVSVVRIGIACSVESPRDRMNISEVVSELQLLRASFCNMKSQ